MLGIYAKTPALLLFALVKAVFLSELKLPAM